VVSERTRELVADTPAAAEGISPSPFGRKVLIRVDGGSCSYQFLDTLTAQRLSYSVFTLPAILNPCWPRCGRRPRDAAGQVRDGAFEAELTGCPT
jgi:hypothetical protein